MRLVSFSWSGAIFVDVSLALRRRSAAHVVATVMAVTAAACGAPAVAANEAGGVPMPGADGAGRTPRPPLPSIEPRRDGGLPGGHGRTTSPSPGPERGSVSETLETTERTDRLDAALAGLAEAPDAAAAAVARARVTALWRVSGSDAASLLAARAGMAAKAGDVGLAMDLLDAAIALAPRWPAAVHERAVLHLLREETGPAIADLRTALALEPRHVPSLSLLSAVMESLGHEAEALALLKQAAALDPHGEDLAERLRRLTLAVEGHEL